MVRLSLALLLRKGPRSRGQQPCLDFSHLIYPLWSMPSFKFMGLVAPKKKILTVLATMGMWPSCSCDLTKTIFTNSCSEEAPHEIWFLIGQNVSEKKMFKNNGHIHVHSPWTGADNPLWSFYLNQRTNGPANAHLISGISTKDKMAEQTLTL